ncbi:hypothetical protein CMUS01_05695 [Colletotrichum musicola]|uniref:Apple domain-containing protein n=1 Tax=Colletotrichum musicola TaxID=2175873 RepID=A0A8H6KQG8_9PEZI|nr:hypothetical protein CMUS01_05695 [Colletotrichum musicola]
MQSLTVASIIAFAAAVQAGPLAVKRAEIVCNVAPSGPATAKITAISQPAAATAEACQKLCEADTSCQAFAFGLPQSGTTPLCMLYSVPAAQIPADANANLKVFEKACTGVPTTPPAPTDSQDQTKKSNVCGVAPSGPAAATAVSPILTRKDIAAQTECLALCKSTAGCKAVEFGKASADEPDQCLLFSVPASQLPAPTSGQTLIVFDASC